MLGINTVLSESSLCAPWVAKGPMFLQAFSEDSDQTKWMPRLICVIAGAQVILLVLLSGSRSGSYSIVLTSFKPGNQPGDVCTGNAFFGCKRQGTATNIINPVQSARLRSSRGFSFKYGKVELEAKMPTGDWLWPGTLI